MQNQSPASQIIESLVRFRKWWLLPTLVCTVLAICYALFSEKSYSSHQTLVIRDDLVGTFYKPGRFDSLDSMKSAQETILELSRRPNVVRKALEKVGPPALTTQTHWLSDQVVEETQGKIQISAPNGAEFGRTEAIVLSVQERTRDRSKLFVSALLDEIESSLKNLRSRQFESMKIELEQAVNVANKSYNLAADDLREFEKSVGPDLSTLISLNDSQAGTNNIQSELANLSIEQRNAWENLQVVKKQIEILQDVAKSPESLPEVPQELLQLQPTLASLAKGLSDAVLKYSATKGKYEPSHPNAGQDFRAIQDIKLRIKDKLVGTLNSLKYQLELRQGKYDQITSLIDEKKTRLGELSSMRVDYATLKEDVSKKREINGQAQANLAEIQTLGGAANEVNLLSRIDEPQTDIYPDGPSNKIIVFGGMAAGLFIGLGMVMFIAPLDFMHPPVDERLSTFAGNNQPRQPSAHSTSNVAPSPRTAPPSVSQPLDETKHNVAPAASKVATPTTPATEPSVPWNSKKQQTFAPESSPKKSNIATSNLDDQSLNTISEQISRDQNQQTATPKPATSTATIKTKLEPVATSQPTMATSPVQIQVPDVVKDASTQKPFETVGNRSGQPGAAKEQPVEAQRANAPRAESNDFDAKSKDSSLESVLSQIRAKHLGTDVSNSDSNASDKIAVQNPDTGPPAYTTNSPSQDVITTTSDSFDSLADYIDLAQVENEISTIANDSSNTPNFNSHSFGGNEDESSDKNVKAIQVPFVDPSQPEPPIPTVDNPDEETNDPVSVAANDRSKDATFAATKAAIQSIQSLKQTKTTQFEPENAQPPSVIDNNFAEANEINATEIEPPSIDFSSLRIGGNDSSTPSENISQLGQGATKNEGDSNATNQPIPNNESKMTKGQADGPPFGKELSTGLPLETSVQNSSENSGNESDPNSGTKPENRPTATTVDLRMLKDQLAGKAKKAKLQAQDSSTTLSDVLSKGATEIPAGDQKNEVVDQSISDLANSIRNMCMKKDETKPES